MNKIKNNKPNRQIKEILLNMGDYYLNKKEINKLKLGLMSKKSRRNRKRNLT